MQNVSKSIVLINKINKIMGEMISLNGLRFLINKKQAQVLGFANESLQELVIPSKIEYKGEDYEVVSINDTAFTFCEELTSVVIPNSVRKITNGAFAYCPNLKKVVLPENAVIATNVFRGSGGFTKINNITYGGKGDFKIGEYKFYNPGFITFYINDEVYQSVVKRASVLRCEREVEGNVVIESFVEINGKTYPVDNIAECAFLLCKHVNSVIIPYNLSNIEKNAFFQCSSLSSVVLPENATIDKDAFRLAGGFVEKDGVFYSGKSDLKVGNYDFCNHGFITFYFKGLAYKGEVLEASVVCSVANNKDVVVQSSVEINGEAFPVTTIGEKAFMGSNMTSIILPDTITTIQNGAFWKCVNLTSVEIPNTVKTIGRAAFGRCASLQKVVLPSKATIDAEAFRSSGKLEVIDGLHYGNSYQIKIGNYDLKGTGFLTFYLNGVAYNRVGKVTVWHCSSEKEEIEIPSLVKINGKTCVVDIIGNKAFANNRNLISVSIPNTVRGICAASFSGCSSLNSLTLAEGIFYIGNEAFSGCSNLKTVVLPKGVTKMSVKAFDKQVRIYRD